MERTPFSRQVFRMAHAGGTDEFHSRFRTSLNEDAGGDFVTTMKRYYYDFLSSNDAGNVKDLAVNIGAAGGKELLKIYCVTSC